MPNVRKIVPRREQDPASCWSIEDLFPSNAAWEEAFAACEKLPEQLAAYRGRLGESAQALLEYLQLRDKIDLQTEPVCNYALLRRDEDTADPDRQDLAGRIDSFYVEMDNATAFVRPELTAIPEDTLERFYREEPTLELYRRHLALIRRGRDHVLSPAEEELLVAMGKVTQSPSNIYNAFNDADLKFQPVLDSNGVEHTVTHGSYYLLSTSQDRTLRKNAFFALNGAYDAFRTSLAAMLNAEVQKNVFQARARHYDTTLQSALFPNEIPESVYLSLIDTVHQNLDKLHRYMALRKKVLGVDELHLYDCSVPLLPEADQVIPFEEAKTWLLEATEVLGEEYHTALASAFDRRWMDIYENEGKASGAYSCSSWTHPYVLLNHNDDLDSAFALAHEMGHAMHSWLSYRYQPTVYAEYALFVAEVASTCSESLLMQYLLRKTQDKRQRAVYINYFLDQFRHILYWQTQLAEFELKIHTLAEAGETLTARKLCEISRELTQQYYGPDLVVDEVAGMDWARIPHFYMKLYVYQYATGFSAAVALSRRILNGGEAAVRDYLKFLSSGNAKDPITLLREAGVDLSTPAPVDEALALFEELVEEMETLLA